MTSADRADIPQSAAESTIAGRAQEQYEWGRVAGQVAAGIDYRVARHAAILAE